MIAGMSTSCFFGRDFLENNIERMEKMGVRVAEVYLSTYCEFEKAFVKDLRSRLDDSGIRVHSVHPHGTLYELQAYANYTRSQADAEQCFRQIQEAACILGAEMTVYHGGFSIKKPGARPNLANVGRVLSRWAEVAKQYGLKFAHENVHWAWFSMPEYVDQLREVVESDNLYYTLDIKQAAQSGYPFEAYIEHMDGRIANVHCCDYSLKDGEVVTAIPGRGDFDFTALRNALEAAGYDGPAMLEVYPSDYDGFSELGESFRKFRAWMQE